MLKHIVLLKLKNSLDDAQIDKLFADIAQIKNQIPGVMSFNYGKAIDENALNQGYTHAYSMDFVDEDFFNHYCQDDKQSHLKSLLKDALLSDDAVLIFNHDLDFVTG